MQFSVLSAGRAAEVGVWTVIGPGTQCLVISRESQTIKNVLQNIETIPLVKKRGVYWLEVGMNRDMHAGSPAGPLAAVKAAAKTIPCQAAGRRGAQRKAQGHVWFEVDHGI